jgi:23S rRNA (uracil1939-C5)-methyltransferase
VAERLVIDHVGHRGDGVSFAGGESLFVPYTLSGETVEAEPVSGHPDRRQLKRIEQASDALKKAGRWQEGSNGDAAK